MDQLIEKAPYLGAVILVVWIFVTAWAKNTKRQDEAWERRDKFDLARMAELERIGLGCHNHSSEREERFIKTMTEREERYAKTVENNNRIIESNIKLLGAMERRMNGKLASS